MTHLNDFKEDQVKKVSYIPVFYYVRIEYNASVLDVFIQPIITLMTCTFSLTAVIEGRPVLSLEGIIAFLGGFVPSIFVF